MMEKYPPPTEKIYQFRLMPVFLPSALVFTGLALISIVAGMLANSLFLYMILMFIGCAGIILWRLKGQKKNLMKNNDAIKLMYTGDLEKSAHILDELCRKPKTRALQAAFVFNRAMVGYYAGDPHFALRLMYAVSLSKKRGAKKFMIRHRGLVNAKILECLGLLGELDEAKVLMEKNKGMLNKQFEGAETIGEAIYALRAQSAKEALSIIDEGWTKAEILLRGIELKPLRLLKAFALQQNNRGNSPEFHHQLQELTVKDLEVWHFYGKNWPEMNGFLNKLTKNKE